MGRHSTSGSQPVRWSTSFWVQPVDATNDENIRVLHRNVLFSIQSVTDLDSARADNDKHVALMKANLLMDIHFNN